ncbi:MAG: glycosyltransferase family 39 protein [Tepidisphaeraceae bacterium]|jgi:hypothetical protein
MGDAADKSAHSVDSRKVHCIALGLVILGIAARLRMYLADRSLWRDEAALALNIIHRSFFGLLRPLDNEQGAPIGFLMLQKLSVSLLGGGEYALRLVPLLASILALLLFWPLCRRVIGGAGGLVALGILALGFRQWEYADQNKQYSTDVLVAVVLMRLAAWALPRDNPSPRRLIVLAAVGAMAIWFSHAAVFVLAGVGCLALYRQSNWTGKTAGILAIVAAVWLGSFAVDYAVCLRPLAHDPYMVQFWTAAHGFAPAPTSPSALMWLYNYFLELPDNPGSLSFGTPALGPVPSVAMLLYFLGLFALWRGDKGVLFLALMPIVFGLAASMAHLYPFRYRLALFTAPLVAVPIGAGFAALFQQTGIAKATAIVALLMLAIEPAKTTMDYLRRPPLLREMRPAVAYIAAHRQSGDICYIYPLCEYGFEYYQERQGLSNLPVTIGSQDVAGWEAYAVELRKLSGHRVWVIFEDTADHDGVNEQQMALHILDEMGRRVLEFQPFGEYVACYDLR